MTHIPTLIWEGMWRRLWIIVLVAIMACVGSILIVMAPWGLSDSPLVQGALYWIVASWGVWKHYTLV